MDKCNCSQAYDDQNREWVKYTCGPCLKRKMEVAQAALRSQPVIRLQLLEDIHAND